MEFDVPMEKTYVMTDCTEDTLDESGEFDDDVELMYAEEDEKEEEILPEFNITIDVAALNRKPKLKEAIITALDPEGKMENVSDELIVEMINTLPELRQQYSLIFYELDKCAEMEGEQSYTPSIVDVTDVEELQLIEQMTGFRESSDGVAHIYAHLNKASKDIIYGNPKVRMILCRMNPKSITDELVSSMLR